MPDDPTEEEIRERCLEIQAGWSEATRQTRLVVKSTEWAVPEWDGTARTEEAV